MKVLIPALFFFLPLSILFAQTIQVRYLGNMGVLVSSSKGQVLIDALHEQYEPDYLYPPKHLTDSIIKGIQPYDQVQYLLFSHRHRDHFSRNLSAEFLARNPQTTLITHAQIADSLPGSEQIVRIDEKLPKAYSNVEISIQPLFLKHTWPERHYQTHNFGYLISMSGKKLIHLGDAEYDPEDFKANQHLLTNIDIAIIPTWFVLFDQGKQILKQYIKAKTVIVTHISPLEKIMAYNKLGKNMVPFFRIGQRLDVH
jgi:L-ascorbate metabolism protein UlaG (beta-lactamase superfamily)